MTTFSWRICLRENSEGMLQLKMSNAEIPKRFATQKSPPRSRRGRFGGEKSSLKFLGRDLPPANRLLGKILRPFALYEPLPRVRRRDFLRKIGSDGFRRRFSAGEAAPNSGRRDSGLANRPRKISGAFWRRRMAWRNPRTALPACQKHSAGIPKTFSLWRGRPQSSEAPSPLRSRRWRRRSAPSSRRLPRSQRLRLISAIHSR